MDTANVERETGTRTAMGHYIPPPGRKALTSLAEAFPGPADYAPETRFTKPTAPKYSVQGKHETRLRNDAEVGPADINTGGNMVWKTKTIYVKSKGETKPYGIQGHVTAGAGPGRYKVDNLGIGKEGPKHTVASRYKEGLQTGPPNALIQPVDTIGVNTPGPSYKPPSERGSKKSIGLPRKDDIAEGPGPAAYDIQGKEPVGPVYSISTRVPVAGYGKQPTVTDTPGPIYDISTTVGHAPAVTVKSRHHLKSREFGPAPNQYSVPETVGNGPSAVLTYKPFEVDQGPRPGPADYTIKDATLKKAPTYSFGQRTKSTFPAFLQDPSTVQLNPAPCDYSDASSPGTISKNDGPKYTMGRPAKQTCSDNPGPNKYVITNSPNTKRGPEYSMGRRLKANENSNKTGPGPAAYYPNISQNNKQGFSITKKPKKRVGESTPASNAYTIQRDLTNKGSTTGPKFTLRSRHSPFVYSGFHNINMIRG